MLLCYITDRKSLAGTERQRCRKLLARIREAAHAGIDYIQLREKDLMARDLEQLARAAVRVVRGHSATAKLLVNGRPDIALAAGADGVHLPAGELAPAEVRALWMQASDRSPIIAVSAHTIEEVRAAEVQGANFAVLAPIFEKANSNVHGIGVDVLQAACAKSLPADSSQSQRRFAVFALGGVTLSNAGECLAAGAAGLAGIRLFQNGDVVETVRRLRELETSQSKSTLTTDRHG